MLKKVVLLLVLGVLILCGCGENRESGGDAPFTVVADQLGREVAVSQRPERIISLSPGNTEIAFALGLEERIAGVTDYCNFPAQVEGKARVGGFSDPSLEVILELEADLVLAGTMHEELIPQLEALAVPVLVLSPESIDDVYAALMLVAEVTGNLEEGETLVADLKHRVSLVRSRLESLAEDEKVPVYFEVYSDPLMSTGGDTLINEIISLAGGRNIFADLAEPYPKVSAEVVVERQPQVIFFPDFHGSADLMVEQMKQRPGWERIPALLENRAYAISDDAFSRPGPRVVDAIEEAAKIFYPELFN